ncbi:MAG: hypothetical protein ABI832_07240 [bacterium]
MAVITRIYDTYADARRAADDVNGLGLMGVDASLLGNEAIRADHEVYESDLDDETSGTATGAGIGAAVGGGAGLLAGLGMLAIPGLGPVVAAGWLAATAAGAVGGAVTGGAVGALADLGIAEDEAPVYSEAVRRGGTLVSVRFPTRHQSEVEAALDRVPAMALDQRREVYKADGWQPDTDEDRRARRGPDVPPVIY